jgi:phasin family protein
MTNMLKVDQLAAANEAAIDQFSYFAKLSLANMEKFAELGLGAARDSVESATKHAQTLAAARDVQEVIAINSAAVEPALKKAYAYSRSAYETFSETNDEVKKVFEKQAADANKAAIAALEEAFKYAPAGSETVVGNVKSAIAAAQSAYENLTAINKQIYDTVEKSVEQNVATVKSTAAKAKRTTRRGK